jgi:hypothetical protein
MHQSLRGALLAASLACVAPVNAGEIFVDFFAPAPNTGFFDPTPAAPVGGNPGLTLGEQRRNVFLQAAAIWTERLGPEQDIFVAAQFEPLAAGVLGSAGAQFIHSNFPGAERVNTWYFDSLADQHFGGDLSPPTYDIIARFSTNFVFYLGFDNNDPPGTSDLLPVVLHEIGHGLNFANAANEAAGTIPVPAGAEPNTYGDIYSQYTLDVTTGKTWNQMTIPERQASAINVRKVSWSGLNVKKAVPKVLQKGEPTLQVNNPAVLGNLMVGTAAFGPALTSAGITGNVVAGQDALEAVAGATTTDGCSPLLNPVAGSIVLLDRGVCAFTVKVLNAQTAGAIAVLIGDNVVALPPPGLGGADPAIMIPAVRISLPDANNIRANLAGGVNVTLKVDLSIRAGTDRVQGLMMVAALNPVAGGSSISHYDTAATPNQLMEPAINIDLTSSVSPPQDLSLPLLTDLGWFTDHDGVLDGEDHCIGSNIEPTVVLGTCDTNAGNDVQATGCSVADEVGICAPFTNRPLKYLACLTTVSSHLQRNRVITLKEQLAILACGLKQL